MTLITEGNLIFSIEQVGSATVKSLIGYVVPPEDLPIEPTPDQNEERIVELETRVSELTVLLGDLLLDGGL